MILYCMSSYLWSEDEILEDSALQIIFLAPTWAQFWQDQDIL